MFLSLCLRSIELSLSPRALSTHCSRQITHGTPGRITLPYRVTRATRQISSHCINGRRCSVALALVRPKITGGGRARSHVSRSTRPNVAGADGGVNRWRREHRRWRPLVDLGGRPRIAGRARARAHTHINATRRGDARERATLFGDRNTTEPEYTHQRRAYTYIHIHIYTHMRVHTHTNARHTRAEKPRGYDSYTPPNL